VGSLADLVLAVSNPQQLTQLCFTPLDVRGQRLVSTECVPPAAFTALTASTQLGSLQVSCSACTCDLFETSAGPHAHTHSHIHSINMVWDDDKLSFEIGRPTCITAQQLQLLCSSCPAVESLTFCLDSERQQHPAGYIPWMSMVTAPSPPPLHPLSQLTALTCLRLRVRDSLFGTAPAATMQCITKLTGLKQLALGSVPCQWKPALVQLTAMTGLERLLLSVDDGRLVADLCLSSKVSCVTRLVEPVCLWFVPC
jgi:hypothetical protein